MSFPVEPFPVEQTEIFHERTRPSGRRFARTRPEATRFRQQRPGPTSAEILVELVEGLLPVEADASRWAATLEAASVGWNMSVMPTELGSAWSDLPPTQRSLALEVARRKAVSYSADKSVIVGSAITEHGRLLEVSVTFVPYA